LNPANTDGVISIIPAAILLELTEGAAKSLFCLKRSEWRGFLGRFLNLKFRNWLLFATRYRSKLAG
jgi:hypothetical protein